MERLTFMLLTAYKLNGVYQRLRKKLGTEMSCQVFETEELIKTQM